VRFFKLFFVIFIYIYMDYQIDEKLFKSPIINYHVIPITLQNKIQQKLII
jgi:hypothetical protein